MSKTSRTMSAEERRAQRAAALAKANAVRRLRAEEKDAMDPSGAIEAIEAVPAWAATLKVRDLLESLHGVGSVRAGRMMTSAQVKEGRVVGAMSERQKAALVALLRERQMRVSKIQGG